VVTHFCFLGQAANEGPARICLYQIVKSLTQFVASNGQVGDATVISSLLVAGSRRAMFEDGEKAMKYFSECVVAATLAFGVLTLAAIDAQAKVVCGPNGCHRVYPYRSQWPVGQPGKYYNTAPWGCAMVGGQRVCHTR
jgi:hypothetical protein